MAEFAKRAMPQVALDSIDANVAAIIPGNTIIVLKSGAVLAVQAIPVSVRRRRNEMDPRDGGPIYDVDCEMKVGKVQSEPINKLSS